ncbi:hypothetical protein Droror1_Dr00023048 [Drosera rotundifolia]
MSVNSNVTAASEVPGDTVLYERYHKVGSMTFVEIYALSVGRVALATIRATIDAMVLDASVDRGKIVAWYTPHFYQMEDGRLATKEEVIVAFMYLSLALQFNCDLRDTGRLLKAEMRVSDSAWAKAKEAPVDKFRLKLQPFTQSCIAALNYRAVRESRLGSWVRA